MGSPGQQRAASKRWIGVILSPRREESRGKKRKGKKKKRKRKAGNRSNTSWPAYLTGRVDIRSVNKFGKSIGYRFEFQSEEFIPVQITRIYIYIYHRWYDEPLKILVILFTVFTRSIEFINVYLSRIFLEDWFQRLEIETKISVTSDCLMFGRIDMRMRIEKKLGYILLVLYF